LRRAVPAVALSALAVATTAGCDNGWWTYHRDPARSGVNAELAAAGRVGASWTTNLDGAVYAQPLVVGGTLVAATENDSLYGLDPATGAVRWRTHVASPVSRSALPCGNVDPLGMGSEVQRYRIRR
jgi:polyvinyl alcohol dehydrogenase (cytochrome)